MRSTAALHARCSPRCATWSTPSGLTTIMVTHDPMAASYAHRVVFLADSRLAGELDSPTVETVAARMTRLEAATC